MQIPAIISHEIYRFHLRAEEDLRLPAFKGSTFRGAFGHAFRRVVCALRSQDCPTCLVREACTYQRVFETRVTPDAGPRVGVDAAPHPYVLVPPLDERTLVPEGDSLSCTLLLMGPGLRILPYLIYAFQELGRLGLGVRRQKLTKMQLGGLSGTVVFEGDLSPFASWLAWGERFHLGKATSFGLGKIRVVLPAD